MTKKLLEIKNLHVSFQSGGIETPAVQGLHLSLDRGETLGIVGESGSGKSVSSMALLGLVPQPPGRITGELLYHSTTGTIDLLQLSEKEWRRYRGNEIAMIFQEPMTSLNPVYSCGRQVAEALRLHQNISRAAAKDRVIQLFKKVELPRPEAIFNAYPPPAFRRAKTTSDDRHGYLL